MKENLTIKKISLINFVVVFTTVLNAQNQDNKELVKELQDLLTYASDLTVKDLSEILCRNTRLQITTKSLFVPSEKRRLMKIVIAFEKFPDYWVCFFETSKRVSSTLSEELGVAFRDNFSPFLEDM
jgi:hypothetical protein